ncbi:MAG TPA: hypothetical protein VH107_09805, partial [Lacipirellulaceae bacterium]|nr:hypothetical protein [Lacipirellulaceae bacterium]
NAIASSSSAKRLPEATFQAIQSVADVALLNLLTPSAVAAGGLGSAIATSDGTDQIQRASAGSDFDAAIWDAWSPAFATAN